VCMCRSTKAGHDTLLASKESALFIEGMLFMQGTWGN